MSAVNGGNGAASNYVYVIGRIEARSPRPSVEKEFAQAIGRADTAGLTNRPTLQKVLSQRQNRYLSRQMCWVMTIEGLETYILVPRDSADLDGFQSRYGRVLTNVPLITPFRMRP